MSAAVNLSSNLKDTITTYCAGAFGIGAVVIALPSQGVPLPAWATAIGGILCAVSTVVSMVFIGKAPNGSAKTDDAVVAANKQTEAATK